MSGDKRTVTTDALDTLGTVPLDTTAKRDAIHLAVEPVIAGVSLLPGERVCVEAGVATSAGARPHLGIVDPFLDRPVTAGERFWFVMNPRTVTSLRHVWAHPAFTDEPVATAPSADKAASEAWLRAYCSRTDCPRYEALMDLLAGRDIASAYGDASAYVTEYGISISGADASGVIPLEFWAHAETVLGRPIANRPTRETYFSCAC